MPLKPLGNQIANLGGIYMEAGWPGPPGWPALTQISPLTRAEKFMCLYGMSFVSQRWWDEM